VRTTRLLALLALAPLGTAAAQTAAVASPAPAPEASPAVAAEDSEEAQPESSPDSPRAAVSDFLRLCREGRYPEAGRYLRAPGDVDAAQLARRFKDVLDRHLWLDLDLVSGDPEGDTHDGLPPGSDEIGSIPVPQGKEPVRLTRRPQGQDPRWVFSRGTVAHIDAWYAALPDRWVRETLPQALLRPGPRELLWWQWLALPVMALLAWGLGNALGWISYKVLARAFARTKTTWDDELLHRLDGPVRFGWTLLVLRGMLPWLGLYAPARAFAGSLLGALGAVTLFWGLWRAADVAGTALTVTWGGQSPSARSLLSIGTRLAKALVAVAGLLTAVAELGYPVTHLVAGLGLGGLAFALAAQKTVENLFGSVSLAVDQPFRVGDFVKIQDFVGTIEAIGLRSTSVRTLDRTLVSIPNGQLADQRLESYSARDRMRLACIVGVEYGTTAAQMRQVLEGLERVLRAHPKIWPDAVVVRFKEFAASSLDIEIMAWFQTPDWGEFQLIRQNVLLDFMQVVEGAGCSFAFPTRTVHLVNEEPTPAA
jgi:MscS family membrane protein